MKTRAVLFDLHHTLTRTRKSPVSLLRELAGEVGIDMSAFSESQIEAALAKSDEWLVEYELEHNVGPFWHPGPSQWLQFDRIMFQTLGLHGLSDELVSGLESRWLETTRHGGLEFLHESADSMLRELRSRGYRVGLVTRRHEDPAPLLDRFGISDLFSVVVYSGVVGYAKPNPYTLLKAADGLDVNPHRCAYVGNLVSADVEAAKRAEMRPVLLVWANPEEAKRAPHDVLVLSSMEDVLDTFRFI